MREPDFLVVEDRDGRNRLLVYKNPQSIPYFQEGYRYYRVAEMTTDEVAAMYKEILEHRAAKRKADAEEELAADLAALGWKS